MSVASTLFDSSPSLTSVSTVDSCTSSSSPICSPRLTFGWSDDLIGLNEHSDVEWVVKALIPFPAFLQISHIGLILLSFMIIWLDDDDEVIRFALGLGLECKIDKIYFGLLCSGVNIVINSEIICDS